MKILLSILLLVAALSFFFLQNNSIPESNSSKTPLKIGINIWPGYAHAFVAQEKGFFKKYGANVQLILKSEISEVNQLYNKGELDGLFNVFTDIIMLNANGIATKAVYITDYSDTGDVIVGRSEFNGMEDLKNKTVSFEGIGSFSQMLVFSLLRKAGIQEGEFKTSNLQAHEVLEALKTGQIDAGHTWEPTVSKAIADGYKILGKAGDIPGIIADVLAFNSNIIKERSQEVRGIVQAMIEAQKFLRSNPDEALTIMAKAQNMAKAEMQAGTEGVHFLTQQENLDAMQPGNGSLFQSGQKSVDFYLKNGQLFQQPDLSTIIDVQFAK